MSPSDEVNDAVGEAPDRDADAAEVERQLAEARAEEAAPERAKKKRQRLERLLAAKREVEAEELAEKWLAKNALAVKKLDTSLDEMVERVRKNPNQRDTVAANNIWDAITEKVELAEVVQRRFPNVKSRTVLVVAPGRRLNNIDGLSIAAPKRQLFPVVTATDSPKLRAALYAREAWVWLHARRDSLPDDLKLAADIEVSAADLSERVRTQRTNEQRQNQAAEQIGAKAGVRSGPGRNISIEA